MGGPGCESVDNFKTILEQEGIYHLLSGELKVPLSSCKQKSVCLLFSANWSRPCKAFIPQLLQTYNALKDVDYELEIIFISFDRDENGFKEHMKSMPWLVVPFDVNLQKKLDSVGLIKDYGPDAFPFTKKKQEELKALDEAKRQEGKLEHLFTNGIDSKGEKICSSELVGKTIGLYFGANWCPPCRDFTTQLIEAYNDIVKNKDQEFEVVYISTDRDVKEFELGLTKMPWVAIPFNDKTRQDLCRIFEVKWIPTLIILGPNGKTITTNGRKLVSLYGAKGFPFTESKILGVESSLMKEGDELARQVMDRKHEHILKLDMAKRYICDFCKKQGSFWAFSCNVCGYDLHPSCIEEIHC
ncbi:unnamed protein product [Lactuca saligna]|uniref:protein-disulfide reductase n=1 Tax=Lactuca saligna TaxID=75948 RepID=A0AA35ZN95_LACSI|nr:unnamed protein product [Lactuca saligna]